MGMKAAYHSHKPLQTTSPPPNYLQIQQLFPQTLPVSFLLEGFAERTPNKVTQLRGGHSGDLNAGPSVWSPGPFLSVEGACVSSQSFLWGSKAQVSLEGLHTC